MSKSLVKSRNHLVYEGLKRKILNLELIPGQAISENEICQMFDVSRTPVRDAFWSLQEQGFIETIPYRGTYVTKLNYDEIKQLIYMRIAVETNVICDFVDIATPMILEEVRYLIRKQEAIIQGKDFTAEQFYHLDSLMHEVWFGVTGKKKIWEVLQEAQVDYKRYRMLDLETETNFTRIIKEHNGLFELIQKKDKAGLTEALKTHLSYNIIRMKHHVEVEYKDYFEDNSDS
ncbi:GntR family transcriptional regulator [Anaerobium acetethylicum]|uniref:DNA-binding transcriptional regulator, GntR family n=1 Tax=Anaerobium acetethylicum TaxID=1619234 RepID=A0A1D3TU62_9FIRM|nr:GntR family transcriptional regulator [Anaerobium acetethylicum]SCP97600.1 DNA-binding transcriptional regulator, GntR family [Anaerobium acetethylicum]